MAAPAARRAGPEELSWPRRLTVLGSTGFIGRSALEVAAAHPSRLQVWGLAARANADLLARQTLEASPKVVAIVDRNAAARLRDLLAGRWDGEILEGDSGIETLAGLGEADIVLNALVGAAGLRPAMATLRTGRTLALANKESLVIAGALLREEARRGGSAILPVDSEHSGIFQCLEARGDQGVGRLILTASGGPFRTRPLASFPSITPAEALRHPTWFMGPRITIDSATLLNKGFEVCEAHWLFDVPHERIDVWIHPQSIVHGLVEWRDGSTTAQLSLPDMRIPIQYALCYPLRLQGVVEPCDLAARGPLEFHLPEPQRYPCLDLARAALREGGAAPAVLNAADEILVKAFLEERIGFPDIARLLREVLQATRPCKGENVDEVLEADRWARSRTEELLSSWRP